MENYRRKSSVRIMRNLLFYLIILLSLNLLASEVPGHSYEQTILNTIREIQSLSHDQALVSTRNLIKQYPHSRLGQMMYADLLLAKAGPLQHIGSGIEVDQAVSDFRHEIQQRWQHETSNAYNANLYPENILFLAENQPYVILVDQQGSRIYVYRNEQGTPVLETDYFISIGLKGWGKQKRGDQKTPVGVYHVTRFIGDEELPDLYGKGAFPISYPNVWDVRNKRTGSGIWIHGTPSYTYNRSPWASNGCIVVSNPDFVHIEQYINAELHTPVVVTEQVNWLSREQWQARRKQWLKTLNSWVGDWESLDHKRYRQHYSKSEFLAYGRDFAKWDAHKRWISDKKTQVTVEYSDLNIFVYPGEKDLVLMQYEQNYASNNLDLISPKEIYWRKFPNRWQIVYEGSRTFPKPTSKIAQNR
ncbi:MAG: L,D-transpeptidase family protein [Gammaproteobacteria bacterium]|nr:L,D-transpeptidase family protein [Gammaproteobacteria bacterium]